MAQEIDTEAGEPADGTDPRTLNSESVALAALHFARLAAAHAQFAVIFVDADTFVERELDKASLDALAEVTGIILRDRERVRTKVARALTSRAHEIVREAFRDAQRDEAVADEVEDRIEERLMSEMGFTLRADEKTHFIVDREDIRLGGGPSETAAVALGKAFGLDTGRSVNRMRELARDHAPIPGPLNRWVPLREVRRYLDRVLDFAVAQRRAAPTLPLSALHSTGPTDDIEPLMDRVEQRFRETTRRHLDSATDEVKAFVEALLRGENLSSNKTLPDRLVRAWAPLCDRLAKFGAQIANVDSVLAARTDWPATALFDGFVAVLTELWIAEAKSALDVA